METGLTFGSWKIVQGNSLIPQKQTFLHGVLVLYDLGDFVFVLPVSLLHVGTANMLVKNWTVRASHSK